MPPNPSAAANLQLSDFPLQTFDKLRYADTDRQGHINNAVFSTFLETGRVELLYNPDKPLAETGCEFVIARIALDLRSELHWPGTVQIGTRIASIGNSSFKVEQALFQNEQCAAVAETIIVQINTQTRRSQALTLTTQEKLKNL